MENKDNKKGLQINEINEKTKVSFRTRLITGIILGLICIPCMILGDWPFAILMGIISCIATYEFIHVLHQEKHFIWIDVFTFIMTISFIYWIVIKNQIVNGKLLNEANHIVLNDIGISTLALAFTIFALFFASFLTKKFNVPDVCYYVTMSIMISLGVQSLYFLRFVPISGIAKTTPYDYDGNYYLSCFLFVYFIIGVCMSDIGAYGVGILFGRHKMNERISPKKTWEGFVGGIVISFVSSFLFGILCCANNIPLIQGVLDLSHWYWIVIISLVMPFVSVVGDFIFSAIKRHYGIKDFSNLLPGHGGILDRLDSILISGIVVTMIILTISYFPFIG